jgi:hypothetical protein
VGIMPSWNLISPIVGTFCSWGFVCCLIGVFEYCAVEV